MVITLEWLNRHRTARGAFTRKQVEALGLRWPPHPKGWLRKLVGREITEEQRRKFEQGASQFAKPADDSYQALAPIWAKR